MGLSRHRGEVGGRALVLQTRSVQNEIVPSLVIFGVAGQLGSRVAVEAISRHNEVTGAARRLDRQSLPRGVTPATGDATSPESVRALAPGVDVIVMAVGGADKTVYLRAARAAVQALSDMGNAPRIIHSGGGGSLLNPEGVRFVDTPDFPAQLREEVLGQAAALDFYRNSHGVTWTYMSPPPGGFAPGERLGHYRSGTDWPVVDEEGNARISYEDYAMALVDEIDSPSHLNARFTVGY